MPPQASKFWDRIAARYSKRTVQNEAAYEQTLARTRSHVSQHDHVVEYGCGTGTTALKLSGSAAHITATDFSGEMLRIGEERRAAQGIENVTFKQVSATVPAADDETVDVVLAFNLLHLIEETDQVFAAVRRQLKPGGYFISKTACMGDGNILLRLAVPVMGWYFGVPYIKKYRVRELEDQITAAGFRIVETGNHPDKPPRRFIVARKG